MTWKLKVVLAGIVCGLAIVWLCAGGDGPDAIKVDQSLTVNVETPGVAQIGLPTPEVADRCLTQLEYTVDQLGQCRQAYELLMSANQLLMSVAKECRRDDRPTRRDWWIEQ